MFEDLQIMLIGLGCQGVRTRFGNDINTPRTLLKTRVDLRSGEMMVRRSRARGPWLKI